MEHIALNAAVADAVRELIGRAAIALRNAEEFSISRTLKLETPQARIFPA